MDKAIKARWVKALRGKKYIQGDGYLCSRTTVFRNDRGVSEEVPVHCCLGVLKEVATGKKLRPGPTALPSAKWCNGIGLEYKTVENLAEMNDNGLTFKRIARWIEKNL